ncbi:MAG: hypothetical protein ACI848_001084 [Roseivirga sp.]|jgi:hypothetical protein
MLFQPTYFSPIAQYVAIANCENIVLEVYDNYLKQSYRNRCYIYTASGKLLLNISILHTRGSKQLTKDVKIDNYYDWQKQHFKTLESAYRSSPYFEFYEDDLRALYDKKHTYLLDLNLDCHEFVMDVLQEDISHTPTLVYEKKPVVSDFRSLAIVKNTREFNNTPYVQVFDDKFGFIPNLSILDLIFMEGPNSFTYLTNQKLKVTD